MTAKEKRCFADEVSDLSALLLQARNALISVQNLHEAEVREAVEDLALRKQELNLLAAGSREVAADPHMVDEFQGASAALRANDDIRSDASIVDDSDASKRDQKSSTPTGWKEVVQSMRLKSVKPAGLRPIWEESRSSEKLIHSVEFVHIGRMYSMKIRNHAPARSGTLFTQHMPADPHSFCQGCCGIFHPIGPFRIFWNAICFLLIIYDFIIIPLAAFDVQDSTGVQVCEWIVTACWTFDIWVSFRTGYANGMQVEMSPKKIAVQYAKTWLILDLFIVLCEWVNRVFAGFASASLLKISRIQRTFKIVRFFRLGRLGKLRKMLAMRSWHLTFSVTLLFSTLMLILHTAACTWYAIGDQTSDGWTTYDGYEDEDDGVSFYVASFRWVIAQINGRIDVNVKRNMREKLFTCFTGIVLGIFYQAVFVSFVTKTMLDLNQLFSENARRQRFARTYLEIYPLSPILTSQVRVALNEYKDVGSQLQKEREFMNVLPTHLQTDVLFEVRSSLFIRHNFFNLLSSESIGVMRLVCQHVVKPLPATKAERVFDTGDVCCRMLFMDKITAVYGELTDFTTSTVKAKSSVSVLDVYITKNIEVRGPGESDLQINKSLIDTWISEPALWIEWSNRGRLVSNDHGLLFEVDASHLAETLKQDQHAYALAAMYAKSIADELGRFPSEELSDILPFNVELN